MDFCLTTGIENTETSYCRLCGFQDGGLACERWEFLFFVGKNTYFLYFRSQAEMAHTCRGTINLAGAFIDSEDSCSFVISNGGAQIFYMRASSEVERQRWVTALELAKAKAIKMLESGVFLVTYFRYI